MTRWLIVSLLLMMPTLGLAQQSVSTTIIIQDEGVTQGRVRTINFTGASVSCTVSGSVATCNVTGGGGGGGLTHPEVMSRITLRF